MKTYKHVALILCAGMMMGSCGMTNTAKGGMIGGGGGAALGALIGGLAGKGKGAAIGAAVGAAVGTGAGVLIGKKMDKAAEEAAKIENAQVEQITDNNGLQAVKVTFASGILFSTSSSTLSTSAKNSLTDFANNVLKQNTGWKNSTAAESVQKNIELSKQRAASVSGYLMACGVSGNQIKSVEGLGEENPVASNSTEAGRQENRRVEIYMYASAEMIKQAESGTLQ